MLPIQYAQWFAGTVQSLCAAYLVVNFDAVATGDVACAQGWCVVPPPASMFRQSARHRPMNHLRMCARFPCFFAAGISRTGRLRAVLDLARTRAAGKSDGLTDQCDVGRGCSAVRVKHAHCSGWALNLYVQCFSILYYLRKKKNVKRRPSTPIISTTRVSATRTLTQCVC